MTRPDVNETAGGIRAAGVRRTRDNIVAAARRHLVESGYHRLSLEQVAADAGVTRVTIYRQFDSKLGLLDAIAEDLAQRADVVSRMRAAADVTEPVAAFTTMVTELCRFWSTGPEVFRRLISLAAVDPAAHEVIGSRERWRYDQVARFVRRLGRAGRLMPSFNTRLATAAIGTMTGFPACDEMAGRLRLPHDRLDRLLIAALAGVIRLD